MKISEVAERAGTTAKTIRYYEQVGILPPPDRSESGYREYGDDVLERLAFIRAAQAVGLTLAQIRGVIEVRDSGTLPCSHVVALLRDKADAIEAQVAALQRMRHDVARLVAQAESFSPQECGSDQQVCGIITRTESGLSNARGPAAEDPRGAGRFSAAPPCR